MASDVQGSGSAEQIVGRFRLVRLIGEGGMSRVYAAERSDDFRQIAAVKLMREGVWGSETRLRFRAERQALASLQHPNIVQLIDGGLTQDGVPYLVMDYVEGEPLDKHCERRRLSLRARLQLMMQVLDAVEYAHQRFVAHCDVKFSNILVTAEGQPRLLDFGLSKLLEPSRSGIDSQLTGASLRPFTLEFASPEQLQGRNLTTATDLYSCAVALYMLLTGTHPFESVRDQPLALVQACIAGEAEAPSHRVRHLMRTDRVAAERLAEAMDSRPGRLARELHGDLDAVLLKGLRSEPDRRYSSAAGFAADLGNFLAGRPVESRRGSKRYRIWKFVKRNRAGVLAALLLLCAVLAGAVGVIWQGIRAERSRAVAAMRFDDARRLTNALLFDFYEAVQKLDGSEGMKQSLVKGSRETLEDLAQQSGTNAAMKLDLSNTYLKLGKLQASGAGAGGSEWADAIASYDRGLLLLEPAPMKGAGRRETLVVKARLLEARSEAEKALGRREESARDAALAREILAVNE